MPGSKRTLSASIFVSILAVAPTIAHGQPTKINGVVYESTTTGSKSVANNADQAIRMKKTFMFPSVDDLSGVMAPKLDEKLYQLLIRNSRFDLIRDPQVVKALAPDDAAYAKAAASAVVHKEAAKVSGADTTVLLKTRNVGTETEMQLEFRDADGELLFSETGSVPGYSKMEVRWGLIEKLFKTIMAKVPFDGTVTGRTANGITVDLGISDLKQGEDLEIVRIVSLQRHPLLKTVVGSDYVRVGRAKVMSVDKTLSFAEVKEEYPGEMIAVGAKVLRSKAPISIRTDDSYVGQESREKNTNEKRKEEEDPFADRLEGEFDQPKQRYGSLGIDLLYGSLAQSQNVSTVPTDYTGSGIGGNIAGELWITKNWILTLGYGFQSATLASATGNTLGDASWKKAEGFGGYRFFPDGTGGIALTGSIGFQAQTFTTPSSGADVSGKKYNGVALRVDGEMVFLPKHKISAGFGFQPFSSLTDMGPAPGAPDGGTVIGFHLGWNYQFSPLFWARLGIQFDTASGNYTNGANVNNKRFAIGPGISYSF
jgi:hypothetical protein